MTYQDDPNMNRRPDGRGVERGWGMGSIILACLVALAVIGGIFAMSNRNGDGPSTAGNTERTSPAATTPPAATPSPPPATTGSGAAR
jgi:hypothetical protein